MECVLAADLGGSSLRVARIAASGDVLGLAVRPHVIGEEADALSWWEMMVSAVEELGTRGVRGVCIGGFTRSQVLVDGAGLPVRPAQCFPDSRASPVDGAAEGTWMPMTAYHPVARLAWVARHDPTALVRARFVLQPAEFLASRLTGRIAADRLANCWAVLRECGSITTSPLQWAGLDPGLLPELLMPGGHIGDVQSIASLAGIPVFMGSMDTWMGTIGAGVRIDDAYVIAGTTDAGGVLTREPLPRPGLVTLPWGEHVYHTGGPSSAGGACIAWAARLLGLADPRELVQLAALAPARQPLLFLPALMGTRAPHWQPDARGALIGLDAGHGPSAIARAVLEGIAFADRDLHGGLPCERTVVTGGGASDRTCQIRADVFGRPVWRVTGEPSLAGAAILAWTGLGAYSGIAAAQASIVRTDRLFTPGKEVGYEALYAAYRRANEAMMTLGRT